MRKDRSARGLLVQNTRRCPFTDYSKYVRILAGADRVNSR